MSLSCCNC